MCLRYSSSGRLDRLKGGDVLCYFHLAASAAVYASCISHTYDKKNPLDIVCAYIVLFVLEFVNVPSVHKFPKVSCSTVPL